MSQKNPLFYLLAASGILFVLFLAFTAIILFRMNSRGGLADKRIFGKSELVGIVEIKGVILDSKRFIEELQDFVDDARVKGIVVRINSPGGAVAPSQEIYGALRAADQVKPVYSSMSSLAASGGYYAALGTRRIFANPGTITGSIGVIMGFANLSRLYEWAKVTPYTIKTGKFKDIGSPSREMTMEDRELLQGMIDNVVGQFRRAVAESRKMPMEKVTELSDGRIFSGEQAKAVKLIDDLGGLEDVVKAIAKEAGIAGKPRTVYPARERRIFDFLMQSEEEEGKSSFSRSLANLLSAMDLFSKLIQGQGTTNEKNASLAPQFLAPFSSAE